MNDNFSGNKFSRLVTSQIFLNFLFFSECGRATVKGGRTSPVVRPPVHTRAPSKPVPKVAEALAVLVQHLVFNVSCSFLKPLLLFLQIG